MQVQRISQDHRTRIHGRSDTIAEQAEYRDWAKGEMDGQARGNRHANVNVPESLSKSWNRRGLDRRRPRISRRWPKFRKRCRRGCFGFEVGIVRRIEWTSTQRTYFGWPDIVDVTLAPVSLLETRKDRRGGSNRRKRESRWLKRGLRNTGDVEKRGREQKQISILLMRLIPYFPACLLRTDGSGVDGAAQHGQAACWDRISLPKWRPLFPFTRKNPAAMSVA